MSYVILPTFVSPLELTIHRTIWTALLLIITTHYYSKWSEFNKLIRNKQKLFAIFTIDTWHTRPWDDSGRTIWGIWGTSQVGHLGNFGGY